jgi:hypothetical protein
MVEPGFDNPEGFWELRDVVALHDRLLKAFQREYDTVAPLPCNWHHREEVNPFREELTDLVSRHFAGQSLWAWKDPRTCLTFDLWKESLAGLGVELLVLFVVRNPLDVARSLLKRNGVPLDRGYGSWFNFNLSALAALGDTPVHFVAYDDFLDDGVSALRAVADGLGLLWQDDTRSLEEELSKFIRKDLRHSRSMLNDLADAPPPVQELYSLLLSLTEGRAAFDVEMRARIEQLAGEHRGYFRLFAEDILGGNKTAWRMDAQNSSNLTTIMELQRAVGLRESEVTEHVATIAELNKTLREKEKDRHWEHTWSWRITAPLRWLAELMGLNRK